MDIAFFGSSLVSAYWNGAATYYRGLLRSLHARGHTVTFYEPDAWDRQKHVDHPDPPYATSVVYDATHAALQDVLRRASGADVVVKASGVGVLDSELEHAVAGMPKPTVFWDVDAPATLGRVHGDASDPFRRHVPRYDAVLTYGGGPPVVEAYVRLGARRCVPVYNAADLSTHHPVSPDPRFACDLALLANRLPDREARVDGFFFEAAGLLPDRTFLLGGSGWGDKAMPPNVRYVGHVAPPEHNAFNCTPLAVLNVSRDSMAATGWSPATRVFEASAAGACLITDAWQGIGEFYEPDAELLVADSGRAVATLLDDLTPARARQIGDAALRRTCRDHVYDMRAEVADAVLREIVG